MQHLKYFILIATTIFIASCDKYDLQGFFVCPSKERVNERFEQSIAYNEKHQEDTLIIANSNEYRFCAAADFHVKTTANTLARYTKLTASTPSILFSSILGDITDQKGGLSIAFDSINNNKGNSIIRTLAGNHDLYFNQWHEYYELFGSSTYFFIVKTPNTSDLFIALESTTGSLGKLQKEWLDAESSKLDISSNNYEKKVRNIEYNRDMALEKDPYADVTPYYDDLQNAYHAEAERLRGIDPKKYEKEIQELGSKWWSAQGSKADWKWGNSTRYIEERNAKGDWALYGDSEYAAWERVAKWLREKYPEELDKIHDADQNAIDARYKNSTDWINDRNTYNDWALFGDTEIDAWERVIKWLNEDYPNDLEKIKEAEKSLFEARKDEFNKVNDFANSYLDSQKALLQAHFDVENSIAEARHEINKELETSKTMYEYLDEETRQLLFNQEDYNKLNKELNRIENESLRLQSEYEDKLRNSTLETVESITSEYQMQYETLMKSYEIAKAELEVAKKKQKLNNVLNERNVRMFINGSWQWVANTEDVANAKAELADAEYAKRVEESGLTQQNSINELTRQQDALGVVIKNFEGGVIDLDEAVGLAKDALGSIPSALQTMFSNISSSSSSSKTSSSSTSSKNKKNGSYDLTSFYQSQNYALGIQDALAKGDVDTAIKANELRNEKIDYLGSSEAKWSESDIRKMAKEQHASGTRYTPGGMTLLGEDGFEAFISSNGRLVPISQPSIGNISGGGVVFNTDQMKNLRTLWDMSNLKFNADKSYINMAQPQQIDQSQNNSITINGMTVDSGSSDGQALLSALRRYVGNH